MEASIAPVLPRAFDPGMFSWFEHAARDKSCPECGRSHQTLTQVSPLVFKLDCITDMQRFRAVAVFSCVCGMEKPLTVSWLETLEIFGDKRFA